MIRKIIIAATAAVLVVATVSEASSRWRHHHGYRHWHHGWGSYRGNPTNTNGFGG
jgi:hypothetical protein